MERNGLWNWVWSGDYWFSLALLSHLFDIYFRRLQLRLTKKTSISLNNDNQERDACKSGCYRYNSRHFSCRNFVFRIKIQQRRWHKWRRQWHNYGLFRCCKSITDTVNFIWLKEFIKMQTNFKIFFISGTECRGILSPKWSANHKITKIWPIARFSWVHCMDQSNDFSVPKCTVCWIAKRISTIQGMRTFFSKRELLNFIEHFGCFFGNFQAPVPIKRWNGIRNAENYGRKCPTVDDLKSLHRNEGRNEDLEDCLNMAIFSTKVWWSREYSTTYKCCFRMISEFYRVFLLISATGQQHWPFCGGKSRFAC